MSPKLTFWKPYFSLKRKDARRLGQDSNCGLVLLNSPLKQVVNIKIYQIFTILLHQALRGIRLLKINLIPLDLLKPTWI
jgi:hypothetical protein